jgi:hypothetical protein
MWRNIAGRVWATNSVAGTRDILWNIRLRCGLAAAPRRGLRLGLATV